MVEVRGKGYEKVDDSLVISFTVQEPDPEIFPDWEYQAQRCWNRYKKEPYENVFYDGLDNGLGVALALEKGEPDSNSSIGAIFGVSFVGAFAALSICALT